MARLLAADQLGPSWRKLYERSGVALALAAPVAIVAPDGSAVQRTADIAMAVAIPWHSHVSLNAVVTDYVPRGIMRSAARVGVLGSSVAAGAGLMLLAVNGPGLTGTLKKLWK